MLKMRLWIDTSYNKKINLKNKRIYIYCFNITTKRIGNIYFIFGTMVWTTSNPIYIIKGYTQAGYTALKKMYIKMLLKDFVVSYQIVIWISNTTYVTRFKARRTPDGNFVMRDIGTRSPRVMTADRRSHDRLTRQLDLFT